MTSRERRIKEIAYRMWEQEGRPEGEGHAHRLWLAAEARFEAENAEVEGPRTEPAVEEPARQAKPKAGQPEKPRRSAKAKAAEPEPGKGGREREAPVRQGKDRGCR